MVKTKSKTSGRKFSVTKRHKRILVAVFLVVLCVWGFLFLTGPNEGKVENPDAAALLEKIKAENEAEQQRTLETEYLTLKYPPIYGEVRNLGQRDNFVSNYRLVAHAPQAVNKTVAINVKESGNLEEDSAYSMRQSQSSQYSQSTQTYNQATVTFMTKNDGTEVTWFAQYKGWLAIVVHNTGTADKELLREAQNMAKTLQWLR